MAEQVELRWRRYRLEHIGLELDVMDGPAVSQGTAGAIRYVVQEDRGVKLRVDSGPSSGLANWRGAYASRGKRFGVEADLTVCGVPARKQEAAIDRESAVGFYAAQDGKHGGHISHDQPAVVSVAVAFAIAGKPVLVEWVVPAAERERYRAAEKRFLGSLTCL